MVNGQDESQRERDDGGNEDCSSQVELKGEGTAWVYPLEEEMSVTCRSKRWELGAARKRGREKLRTERSGIGGCYAAENGERPAKGAAAGQDGVPLLCSKRGGGLEHSGDGDERESSIRAWQ